MDQETEAVLLYVTVPNMAEAKRLAEAIVSERLVACANILPLMESVYWWEGAIQHASEVVLLLKTTSYKQKEAIAWLTDVHPYECPCIVVLPITAGYTHFLSWIQQEVK